MTNNYYQKHKEKLQKEAGERYQNLSEGEKDERRKRLEKDIKLLLTKKRRKRRNKNLSQEEKQKLAEYRRNYCLKHNK